MQKMESLFVFKVCVPGSIAAQIIVGIKDNHTQWNWIISIIRCDSVVHVHLPMSSCFGLVVSRNLASIR